jgi:predicted phosphodiesterase
MLAIVSDIHSNIEATRAVLAHIDEQGCEEVICLGDVIGYGPSPEECLKTARERFSVTLMGNHEWAVLNEPFGFNPVARSAVEWTRRTLTPRWYSSRDKKESWEFLQAMPFTHKRGKFLFVHASPTNPTEEYLLARDVDEILGTFTKKLQLAFDRTEWVSFVGHTHYPGIFIEEKVKFVAPVDFDQVFKLAEGKKFIVNVGSVGQPRDSDNRACYVTLDRGVIRYHRVEYDVETTYNKVMNNDYLDESLAKRLKNGQ